MVKARIIYVAAIVLAAIGLFYTNSAVGLLVLTSLVLVVVLDYISLRVASSGILITATLPPSIHIGDSTPLELIIERPWFRFPVGEISIGYSCHNRPFDSGEKGSTVLWAGFHRTSVFDVDLPLNHFGRTDVSLGPCRFHDALGLFARDVPLNEKRSIDVHPRQVEPIITLTGAPQARLSGELYDKNRHGFDPGEVFAIRDYEPGDTPNAIHWKLSSKLDQLVTKEFSNPSDYNLLVAIEVDAAGPNGPFDDTVTNAVCSVGMSLSGALAREGFMHELGYDTSDLVFFRAIDSPRKLAETVEEVLVTRVPDTYRDMASRILDENPARGFTKVILVTAASDEASWERLAFDCDLTVMLVSATDAIGAAKGGRYELVMIDADDYAKKMKVVDI